jgi:hypothetical protein
VCDAPLPGPAELGVQFLTGGISGAGALGLSKALAGTDLTTESLFYVAKHLKGPSGWNATPIDIATTAGDVEASTLTSSIGASCK